MKKIFCLVLTMTLVIGLSGFVFSSSYEAIRVDDGLRLGAEWPLEDDNVITLDKTDIGDPTHADLWMFWCDDNIYLEFHVNSDWGLRSQYPDVNPWLANSIEVALAIEASDPRTKWFFKKSDSLGFVAWLDGSRIDRGEGIDFYMFPTDFGFKAQIILDTTYEENTRFNPLENDEQLLGLQINLSEEGDSRDNMIFDVARGAVNRPSDYTTLKFVD